MSWREEKRESTRVYYIIQMGQSLKSKENPKSIPRPKERENEGGRKRKRKKKSTQIGLRFLSFSLVFFLSLKYFLLTSLSDSLAFVWLFFLPLFFYKYISLATYLYSCINPSIDLGLYYKVLWCIFIQIICTQWMWIWHSVFYVSVISDIYIWQWVTPFKLYIPHTAFLHFF